MRSMDMVSILGRVAGGMAVRAAACVAVVYAVAEAWTYVAGVFGSVSDVLR